ncbi:hypothetical protein Syun_019049 [Stephania yunnanensis]|uniref:ATP-dependent RNA helicase n=1 Tax=Stephania yunnanensis TaxID=152371 RepID=A0AAP0NVJ8_9MAGN
MSFSPFLIRQRSRTLAKLLCNLSFHRSMGGGPRTFPGGINKWQWKRMHEKKAKEKERRLLDQEKQIYQARIRSQIRAKLAAGSEGRDREWRTASSPSYYNPMSPKDQIKALADRFMKEGAEDLWNEDDGELESAPLRPIQRPVSARGIETPMEFRNDVSDRRNLDDNRSRVLHPLGDSLITRRFSVQARRRGAPRFRFRRNGGSSSDGDDDSEIGLDGDLVSSYRDGNKVLRSSKSLPSFNFNEGDASVDDESGSRGRTGVNKIMSRGSLGSYDAKKVRRTLRAFEGDDSNLLEQVQFIREELNKRKSIGHEVGQEQEDSFLTHKRFDECGVSPLTIKVLTSAGYVHMTKVQEATLSVCLEGMDALVKAKTGTGKSAAFLLPAIEAVVKAKSSCSNQRTPPIVVLILCPTRELASQIAAEATVLLKHHDGIGVQTLIGGTRFKLDQKRLESDPCQIIVATPGRLLDHIENKSGFSVRLMGLKMLVLDEADHLLDLGFRKDVEKLVDCVPRQRQSLLFSATIPKEVRRISQLVLRKEHAFIDTVGLSGVETPSKVNNQLRVVLSGVEAPSKLYNQLGSAFQVKQSYLVQSHELQFQLVHQLLKDHTSQVIVFCNTAMVTSLLYLLLREMMMNVRELHSRKTQFYRTRISDEFRESKRLILITSDVSARGMNYPDVTLVIQLSFSLKKTQLGIPSDRVHYIHRLGRTGREDKEGEGILILAPWEEHFLDDIKDLPIKKSQSIQLNPNIKLEMDDAMMKIDNSIKEAAYHAWLGYYNSIIEIGRDKTTLVELANRFSSSIGLEKPPSLFRKTALKMGLKDIPGIRIRK